MPLLLGLSLTAGCTRSPVRPELVTGGTQAAPVSVPGAHLDLVTLHADRFELMQGPDGSYLLTPRVQTHLKAEIAMAMATAVTGDTRYAASASRDLDWIIRERLEPDGGLQWDGPTNPYFFEVHQHWFLTASELVRRHAPTAQRDLAGIQESVWRYLSSDNPAHEDFYLANRSRSGAYFAYRDVNRDGVFQTQAPFKGSYEIGAALWSLALHSEAASGSVLANAPEVYDSLVRQALEIPGRQGFFDRGAGRWIRALRWNGQKWNGEEPPDWKYSLHMEEGVLEAVRLLGGSLSLRSAAYRELEHLVGRVTDGGEVVGLPDPHGSERYEIGLALSCLSLGAEVYASTDPRFAARCRIAANRVCERAGRVFLPESTEDSAVLLAGFCRFARLSAPI